MQATSRQLASSPSFFSHCGPVISSFSKSKVAAYRSRACAAFSALIANPSGLFAESDVTMSAPNWPYSLSLAADNIIQNQALCGATGPANAALENQCYIRPVLQSFRWQYSAAIGIPRRSEPRLWVKVESFEKMADRLSTAN